jgi:hypothetical protein
MSLKSILFTSFLLVLIAIPAMAEDPPSGYQRPRWRKAMRATHSAWDDAKTKYEEGMANYYYAAYVYDLYDSKVKALSAKEDQLKTELSKPKPPGLNAQTDEAWNRKINNLKLDLAKVQAERTGHEATLKQAELSFKTNSPELLRKELDEAAKIARYNAENNDKKDIRKGRKILNETLPSGEASYLAVNQITLEANRRARDEFIMRYPEEEVPGTRRRLAVISDPVGTGTPSGRSTGIGSGIGSGSGTIDIIGIVSDVKGVPISYGNQNTPTPTPTPNLMVTASTSPTVTPTATPVADKTGGPACDQAYAEIVKLLLSKDHYPKAFADMIHLAQLKLAYRMTDPKMSVKTLEAYVKKNNLHASVKSGIQDTSSEFSKSLTTLYSKFGIEGDTGLIKNFEREPGYVKARLNNESASAVMLYLSKNEKDVDLPIQESDAAAVWAMKSLMKDKKVGSADYNLLNFSTRLCQYFKDSSCGSGSRTPASLEQIKKDHDTKDKLFAEKLSKASEKWARDPAYKVCFEKEYCNVNEPVVLGMKDIENLKSKLAEVVAKSSVEGLEGKVEVDPSRTLSKGGDLTLYLKEK